MCIRPLDNNESDHTTQSTIHNAQLHIIHSTPIAVVIISMSYIFPDNPFWAGSRAIQSRGNLLWYYLIHDCGLLYMIETTLFSISSGRMCVLCVVFTLYFLGYLWCIHKIFINTKHLSNRWLLAAIRYALAAWCIFANTATIARLCIMFARLCGVRFIRRTLYRRCLREIAARLRLNMSIIHFHINDAHKFNLCR